MPFHMLTTTDVLRVIAQGSGSHLSTSGMPSFMFPSLSITGSSYHLQAVPLPKGVHEVCCCGPLALAVSGFEGSAVPRPLAHLRAIPDPGVTGHRGASVVCGRPRPESKSREELSGTISNCDLHWGCFRQCVHEGLSISSPCGRHPAPSCPVQRVATIALVLHLMGKLTSISAVVPLGQLSLRTLQRWLNGFRLDAKRHRRLPPSVSCMPCL